jgi:Zn-dependent protease with chaperone function
VPEPDDVVDRESVPQLTALADRVAESLGTRPADALRLDPEFNASVVEVGWRRRRVLSIGVPLFAVLEPQERVSVLAHEFGHFVNGDPLRRWFAHTAVNSLLVWAALLQPQALFEDDDSGLPWPLMLPVNLVMLVLSWVPLGAALGLIMLTFRDSQRAEYLADVRSAEVAGSDAVVSSFAKLHLDSVYDSVAQASSDANWLNHSLWDELRMRATRLPDSERERARRIGLSTADRVDLSHPPTAYRSSVVAGRKHEPGRLRVSPDDPAAIDAELRRASDQLQRDVIDHHLARLSYG